ncbi:MAG: DEAD/DEAH box helicase family protein, partial [Dehalococcoidales bacterium]|nr:DEAD/DEAH box helicase family protein [Dehalococcoidales bacterium]
VEPLEPAYPRRETDVEELAAMLNPGGLIARSFDKYEHRTQQVDMLRKVADAINKQRHLIVEAGTGTGKSLAYLLPAAKFAADNNQHVVISTKTINLQDQLFNKDIPDLQRMLPFPFKAALVKGRSNYLCLRRYGIERRRQSLTTDEVGALVKVLVWLPATTTGDRAEISLTAGERAIWPRIAADGEHCLGAKCPFHRKRTCFLYRARWRAAGSHVIVVNHALLLSELGDSPGVLPDYNYLIVDEAHNLEDVATEQLGKTVGRRELEGLLDDVSRESTAGGRVGLLGDLYSAVRSPGLPTGATRDFEPVVAKAHALVDEARLACREFAQRLGAYIDNCSPDAREYAKRLRLTNVARCQAGWGEVEDGWETVQLRLMGLENEIRKLATMTSALVIEGLPDGERLVQDLDGVLIRSQTLREVGTSIVATSDPTAVQWAENSARSAAGLASLRSAPLHVGDMLQQNLFEKKEAVILTSATMSISGSFDYVAGRLGLQGSDSAIVDSPFDYKNSTLLFVPQGIPEPGAPGHQKAVERAIVDLCLATDGRALILFTSHSQLAATFHAIRRPLQQEEILVLAQRVEGTSRRQLLRTFRSNPRTVLLGSASFWEGVDVVGDALSVLVIAKLPFAVPSEPVFAARSETFADPFNEYGIPQAVLRFKQGFGRLIRSRTDRGVVVVLDRRLYTKSYGAAFLRSLPQCTVRNAPVDSLPGEAVSWLQGKPQAWRTPGGPSC